jgi:NTP pyrophosphatase (non-canonical NTP hydrolase)
MEAQTRAIELIINERKRQDEKWGKRDHHDFVWNAILNEEVGEVAHELLNPAPYRLRKEIVQVAAVAVAWIEMILNQEEEALRDNPHQDIE